MKEVIIYTDGACLGNPGPGGWAALLIHNQHRKTISGGQKLTTNNRMELLAAIEAIKALKGPCKGKLYTDSKYVQQGIMNWLPTWKKNNWTKKGKDGIKNLDLWKELDSLFLMHEIEFHWVKGHSNDIENDLVDELASKAAQSFRD